MKISKNKENEDFYSASISGASSFSTYNLFSIEEKLIFNNLFKELIFLKRVFRTVLRSWPRESQLM